MKTIKKTISGIFLGIFILGAMIALNFVGVSFPQQESVYADTNSIKIGETSYTTLQEAIGAVPYNEETEIKISGDFSISSGITISGDRNSGYKKIIFNAVGDTTITRANLDPFDMFSVNQYSEVTFKTSGSANLIFDGNRGDAIETETVAKDNAVMFRITSSKFILNGESGDENDESCKIIDKNNCANVGACVYVSSSSNATIKSVEFTNNFANGLAAGIYNEGKLEVSNCTFKNNFGGAAGGAIYSKGTTNITGSVFDGNGLKGYQQYTGKRESYNYSWSANTIYGGAMAVVSGTTTIDNCEFKNNSVESTCDACGGAIDVSGGTVNISSTTFSGNSATYGGAIGVYGSTTVVTVDNSTIDSNSATKEGGGIWLGSPRGSSSYPSKKSKITLNNTIVSNNLAHTGGGICLEIGNLYTNDSIITGNTAEFVGGIYMVAACSYAELTGGEIGNNVSTRSDEPTDFFICLSSVNGFDGSSAKLSTKFTTKNANVIHIQRRGSEIVLGKGFEIADGSWIDFAGLFSYDWTYILVDEHLETTKPILIKTSPIEDWMWEKKSYYHYHSFLWFYYQEQVAEDVEKFQIQDRDNDDVEYFFKLVDGYENIRDGECIEAYVKAWYNVEFYNYTGGKVISTQKVIGGEGAIEPTAEEIGTREGYRFTGWSADFSSIKSNNVKIYGVWGKEISIIFKIFDDATSSWTQMHEEKIISETKVDSLPEIPAKTGYAVSYWAYNTSGSTAYNDENFSSSTTLYAIYVPDILMITFIHENGSTEEIEINYNSAFTKEIPQIESKTGFDQTAPYWAYDESGENAFDATKIITENFSLYEIYKINQYLVEFYVNYYHNLTAENGKELLKCEKIGSKFVEYNQTISEFPEMPLNSAFTQNEVSWDYNNSKIVDNISIFGDIDINVYIVKFEADGEIVNSYTIEHGKNLTEIPNIPSKVGHDQVDPTWHLQGVELNDEITSNRTFVAKYTQNIYTVTFILPDENRVERLVRHGETVNSENIIERNFGELVRYDHALDNITGDCEIHVSKINLFMWIMIAFGAFILIISTIILIKYIKKKKIQSIARKRNKHRRHVGPFITGDDD